MKLWKRNAIIATVLLFVCAGIYLNWTYSGKDTAEDITATLSESQLLTGANETLQVTDTVNNDALTAAYTDQAPDTTESFSEIRLSRQQARDSAVSALQEAMSYESGEDNTAVTTSAQALDALVNTSIEEAQIESLVIAKGYADCVAYMTDDGISLAVSAPDGGLDDASVAQIADIVTSQSDYHVADLRIIEVK